MENVDILVEKFKSFKDLSMIGGEKWFKQNVAVQKMSMISNKSLKEGGSDPLVEALIMHEKVDVIVKELVNLEFFRRSLLPLLENEFEKVKETHGVRLKIKYILDQEVLLGTILQNALQFQDIVDLLAGSAEGSGGLIDYCVRQLIPWTQENYRNQLDESSKLSNVEDNQKAYDLKDHSFTVAVRALTILRFLSEAASKLDLCCLRKLNQRYDLPVLAVSLIENAPWIRKLTTNKELTWQKYEETMDGSVWKDWKASELLILCNIEAQPWLILINLLFQEEFGSRYLISEHRKTMLTKCRRYITETLTDQIPFLIELRRFLDEMSVFNCDTPSAFDRGHSAKPRSTLRPFINTVESVSATEERIEMLEAKKDEIVAKLLAKNMKPHISNADCGLKVLANFYSLDDMSLWD